MPSYKLYYFDIRGLGELPRLLFTASGTPFENVRVPREQWPELKPTMPFGQMPVLEVDGKKYAQSMAIVTYLTEALNMGGKTPLDRLATFQVIGMVVELRTAMGKVHFEQDPEKKKAGAEKLEKEDMPKILGFLEKLLTENGTGYFVGNDITTADLAVYDLFEMPLKKYPDLLSKYPKLAENRQKVASNARIAAYLKTRPETEM